METDREKKEKVVEQYIKNVPQKKILFPKLTFSDSALQTSSTQTMYAVPFVLYVHSITGVIRSL